jgi:hypothetical protein
MCEACNSDFNTVGDKPLSFVGSGQPSKPSPYTKSLPKNTMGRGASPTGTMAIRSNVKLPESGGPKCTVVATLYRPNAAEASAQLRNTHNIPSKAGVGDFWQERARQGQVI